MVAIICLLISHILLELVTSSSDTHHACAAEPGGDVWVDGDIAGHVAGPEPLHGVEEGDLGPGGGGLGVQEHEVLEHAPALPRRYCVRLEKLYFLHLVKRIRDHVNWGDC